MKQIRSTLNFIHALFHLKNTLLGGFHNLSPTLWHSPHGVNSITQGAIKIEFNTNQATLLYLTQKDSDLKL